MNDWSEPLDYRSAAPRHAPDRPWRLFTAEGLTSAGTNLLITAIYFYMTDRYHWGLKQNLLLACGQGLLYVGGALTADSFARRMNRHVALTLVYVVMAMISLAAFFAIRFPSVVAAMLLLYSCASAVGWPIIESLASSGVESHALSRRIAAYNAVWSTVSIFALAGAGTLIVYWPAGIFLVPFTVHGIASVLMLLSAMKERRGRVQGHADAGTRGRAQMERRGDTETRERGVGGGEGIPSSNVSASPRHYVSVSSLASSSVPRPEPELLRVRTLALWLSRVALPAAYVVLFSLSALMPSLPLMKQQTAAVQTILAATWMVARGITFLLFGIGSWWHTRPRLMLVAAVVMLVAFFGITVRPSDVFAHGSSTIDLITMVISQLALGAAVGMIYTASLYFGMVLSEGSTEHGGYHEALIGAGFILGPGAGVVAQIVRPGDFYAGIVAVGAVVFVSVVAVAVTSIIARGKEKAIQV